MSLLSRAGDLVYTFRFIKLLTTKFENTDAFKYGIIDANGKRIKTKKVESSEEKSAYTSFHKLVFNVKKVMSAAPGGGSKLASYAAALFLLKEKHNLSEKQLDKILEASDIDLFQILEEDHAWYLLDNLQLSPGSYKLRNEKVLSETWDDIVYAKDLVIAGPDSFPTGSIFGMNIYEVTHKNTGKKVHITLGEIYK